MDIKAFAKKILPFAYREEQVYNPDRELGLSVRPWALDYYYRNDYENSYPSIRVLAQKFAAIEPFAVDAKGKSVPSNVLDRLYTPNNQMSAYDFREALAIMSCVHNKVYIKVHHTGTKITADSITGFTFLEGVVEHIVMGQLEYWTPNGYKLNTNEVLVLKSINPYLLADGFSPAFAARRWTSLDDLIADYQTGFFRGGAIPAGQFMVTAKTSGEFKDIVSRIKAHHQGARASNNVMYSHRPVGADGKPVDAQIEWVPFQTNNKDLALKDLFEQANKKIDSVYGVPASLRGVNDNNTYASVRVDQQIFVENTLQPFTLKIWQKFTHELNRITGGMGIALTFEIDTPVVADEEKVKAEAQQVIAQTVINLTDAGYSLDSVIQYIESDDVSNLVKPEPPEEKPEVLNAEEARDTPDQPVDPSWQNPNDKAAKPDPKGKALSPDDRARYEAKLHAAVLERMTAQVKAAEALIKSKDITTEQPVDPEEDQLLTDAIAAVLMALMSYQGAIEQSANIKLILDAGIRADNVSPFMLTGEQRAKYMSYLKKVATSYNAQTAERIRNILDVAASENTPAADIKKQLRGLLDEKWRIDRIAVTETNKAGNQASLFSMENIAKETGAQVEKVWQHTGSDQPCEYCAAFIGVRVPLSEDFVRLGERIEGSDGGVRINNFEPIDVGGMHANCHCRQTYEVVA